MRTPEPIVWTVLLTLAIASDTGTAASEPPGHQARFPNFAAPPEQQHGH